MKYKVSYFCVTHIGRYRKMNQDNYICEGRYGKHGENPPAFPVSGCITRENPAVVGVFDGMGGEERGEMASLIAAEEASRISVTSKPLDDLLSFCKSANERICRYAEENGIRSTGTTAAMLEFSDRVIGLCNIGDSKIFRYAKGKLRQISVDHVVPAAYGMKAPLSQSLGIPPSELVIDPYAAKCRYKKGDVYLICSDGLTDMVPQEEIAKILAETEFGAAAEKLLAAALANGGKDNITIVLCKVEKDKAAKRAQPAKSQTNAEKAFSEESAISEEPTNVTPASAFVFDAKAGAITHLTEESKTLTEIVIPAEINGTPVTEIGELAFHDCTSLTSVTIPNSITSISSQAFIGCTSLADIYYTGTETQWNNIGKYYSELGSSLWVHYNCR